MTPQSAFHFSKSSFKQVRRLWVGINPPLCSDCRPASDGRHFFMSGIECPTYTLDTVCQCNVGHKCPSCGG